jgi:hypothetical protein
MRAIIYFKPDSPYYTEGSERSRTVENLTEVHYCYESPMPWQSTAFESDIDGTGFTIRNDYIESFEITP